MEKIENKQFVYPTTPAPQKNNLVWFIVGGIAAFLIIVFTGVIVGVTLIQRAIPKPIATPPEQTSVPPVITAPITPRWATDAGVLKIRDDLRTLQGKIDTIDFFEPQISPPSIDLGISIK